MGFVRFLSLAALVIVAGCVTSSDTATMTAAEIQSELVGQRLGYDGAFSGDLMYKPGGVLSYTASGKSYSGNWRLQGDKMCTRFETNVRDRKWSCFTFERTGNGKYKTSLGYRAWRK